MGQLVRQGLHGLDRQLPVSQQGKSDHLAPELLQTPPAQGGLLFQPGGGPGVPPPGGLDYPGGRLGGDGHKGKLVGVLGPLQVGPAQLPAVLLTLLMPAVGLSPVAAADGANRALHGAAHADLLLDAPLDLGDQVPVAVGAHHVGAALEPAVPVPGPGHPAGLPDDLRLIDAGGLSPGRPLVVEYARLAHKHGGKLLQSPDGEPLKIPVDLVVAQPHGKGVHLLRLQGLPGQGADQLQVLRAEGGVLPALCLLDDLHCISLLNFSA